MKIFFLNIHDILTTNFSLKYFSDPTLEDCFVRSILRAIKYDSKEAQLLFPTLLQIENLRDDRVKSVFIFEVSFKKK